MWRATYSVAYHDGPEGSQRYVRIISQNGHLGFAPLKPESSPIGVTAAPHCIGADSGSDDVGPEP